MIKVPFFTTKSLNTLIAPRAIRRVAAIAMLCKLGCCRSLWTRNLKLGLHLGLGIAVDVSLNKLLELLIDRRAVDIHSTSFLGHALFNGEQRETWAYSTRHWEVYRACLAKSSGDFSFNLAM